MNPKWIDPDDLATKRKIIFDQILCNQSQARLLRCAIADEVPTKGDRGAYERPHRTAQPMSLLKLQQFSRPGRQQTDGGLNQHALER